MVGRILRIPVAIFRLFGFGIFTILWIAAFPFGRLMARESLRARIRWRSVWMHVMLPFLGIRVKISGHNNLISGPVIYVGNHRSYLDPIIALKFTKSVVVGKAEVSRWPLIGAAATLGGVIFVKREDRQSRNAALGAMAQMLMSGYSVLVYPEGTTTRAPGLLPFRSGAFDLAARLGIPVVPVAMEFEEPDLAWTGTDTFLPHFLRTFGKLQIAVHLHFGPSMQDNDGLVLMEAAHSWIANELHLLATWVLKQ